MTERSNEEKKEKVKKSLRVNPGGNLGPRWITRDKKGRFKKSVPYKRHLGGRKAHRTRKVKKAKRRLAKSILLTAIPALALPARVVDSVRDVKIIVTDGRT